MPKVFISHKSQDTLVSKKIKESLSSSLIYSWLDDADLSGGANLANTFITEIDKCDIFMPIISELYVQSAWCMDELDIAYPKKVSKQLTIIPIVIGDPQKWKTNPPIVQRVLASTKYISFDKYDEERSCAEILDSINKEESVYFKPLREITTKTQKLLMIDVVLNIEKLPTDFIQSWKFRLNDFIANAQDEDKPLKYKTPILLSGRCPNWLLTYLVMPFVNKRDVYIFNNNTNDYICVYSLNGETTGTVIIAEE